MKTKSLIMIVFAVFLLMASLIGYGMYYHSIMGWDLFGLPEPNQIVTMYIILSPVITLIMAFAILGMNYYNRTITTLKTAIKAWRMLNE